MSAVQALETSFEKKGLVMVLTGDGKGKTTSAFGQALRAIGHGYQVCMIQFMKRRKYGEILATEKYLPGLTIIQSGLDSFVIKGHPSPSDLDLAQKGLKKAKEIMKSQEYFLLILDEINVAVDFHLISETEVLELMKRKPPELHLLLTGRYATQKIMDAADMVSEITQIRHHYDKGIVGQMGIEY
ncbi:MAG TPA: cob(I)yrinic acid a,c-diamide adenosyltransferase [Ruminococcaceae bacterium]|nr:cob(I)yrinic acid a,c-diamide adenosyltransferase [Oscillospiraceae bacterium]